MNLEKRSFLKNKVLSHGGQVLAGSIDILPLTVNTANTCRQTDLTFGCDDSVRTGHGFHPYGRLKSLHHLDNGTISSLLCSAYKFSYPGKAANAAVNHNCCQSYR